MNEHGPGWRPVAVIALMIAVVIVPPLLKDLYEFGIREWDYRKFKRLHAGEYDDHLPLDWTPSRTAELSQRLKRQRDRR